MCLPERKKRQEKATAFIEISPGFDFGIGARHNFGYFTHDLSFLVSACANNEMGRRRNEEKQKRRRLGPRRQTMRAAFVTTSEMDLACTVDFARQ